MPLPSLDTKMHRQIIFPVKFSRTPLPSFKSTLVHAHYLAARFECLTAGRAGPALSVDTKMNA